MKSTLINLGLRLYGVHGKLAGYHTSMGLAVNALLVTSAAMLAVANALMVAKGGDYGGAIAMLLYSEELRAALVLFGLGKLAAGSALKTDKNTATMIAIERGDTGVAEAVARGEISPKAVIEQPNP